MRSRILRDMRARKEVSSQELQRTVWRYLSRNTTVDPQIRMKAQMALSFVSRNSSPASIKNRCILTGRGRGVLSQWRMCRFQFRLRALHGEIPGVSKASWS
ncbi:40S ribosomal protein mrp2, mitochondrial [Coemansia sp. RSA 552]|nr:40S ribosomal protein mrp2, mitochondrial [Coemansia sp. RSA 552]